MPCEVGTDGEPVGDVPPDELVDGEFEIETWEGSRREPSRRLTGTAEGGRLVLALPVSLADFAV